MSESFHNDTYGAGQSMGKRWANRSKRAGQCVKTKDALVEPHVKTEGADDVDGAVAFSTGRHRPRRCGYSWFTVPQARMAQGRTGGRCAARHSQLPHRGGRAAPPLLRRRNRVLGRTRRALSSVTSPVFPAMDTASRPASTRVRLPRRALQPVSRSRSTVASSSPSAPSPGFAHPEAGRRCLRRQGGSGLQRRTPDARQWQSCSRGGLRGGVEETMEWEVGGARDIPCRRRERPRGRDLPPRGVGCHRHQGCRVDHAFLLRRWVRFDLGRAHIAPRTRAGCIGHSLGMGNRAPVTSRPTGGSSR